MTRRIWFLIGKLVCELLSSGGGGGGGSLGNPSSQRSLKLRTNLFWLVYICSHQPFSIQNCIRI